MHHHIEVLQGKRTIVKLLFIFLTIIFISPVIVSCKYEPPPLPKPDVREKVIPLPISKYEKTSLRKVSLVLEQSFDKDHKNFHYIGPIAATHMLALLGVEVVETPPYDAIVTIQIEGTPHKAKYVYVPEGGRRSEGSRETDSWEGASAKVKLTIDIEGHEPLAESGYCGIETPYAITGRRSLGEAPMDEAVVRAVLNAFMKLWSDQILYFATNDPDPIIRDGAKKTWREKIDREL